MEKKQFLEILNLMKPFDRQYPESLQNDVGSDMLRAAGCILTVYIFLVYFTSRFLQILIIVISLVLHTSILTLATPVLARVT